METSAPGGTRNCFSRRSCPSSRWYHDHSIGRRCGRTNLNYTGSST
jgi:hypothetical protein